MNYIQLKKAIKESMNFLGVGECELSLLLTDNDEIRTLNKEFRKNDCPTDVLSFEGDINLGVLGDIVISVERAKEDFLSCSYGDIIPEVAKKNFESYLLWLIVHGILHNLGFDHDNDVSEKEMRSKEKDCLEKVSQYL
ncbi:rRNA maturation RNase YbeY [Thermodesulfobium acidiphilum]|uniref:rRNA maturation RNase YbeY n=1 Tax=Thermodesulfobium acidiphilum TaxID=1794699 RepID=UPI0018FF8C60|nr:rRNA maturation RNase YbeY [Thermodesulfobium acidiphilum]